jgi:pimeloyl-ACP methyl ester carboxylesterase
MKELGRITGDGVELAYAMWPGAGAPIVGIHGLTASHLNFVAIADRLAGQRPLIAFDLRGRGDSDKPAGPYGMAQHARDVAAAMRALGLGPSVVVGHSMGAYIAAALAADAPELVAHVVLLDGGFMPPLPPGVPLRALLESLVQTMVARLSQTFASREAYHAYWRAQPMFEPRDWNAWLDEYIDYDLGADGRPKAHEPGVRVDFFDMAESELVAERLRRVRAPVTMIRAEHGFSRAHPMVMPDAVVRRIAACAPHARDVLVAQTTHYTIALAEPGASRVAELLLQIS